MKKIILYQNRGQAIAEMAIFGSLILLAFSVLLVYGQRLEAQQQMKMEAFRLGLLKAWQRNSAVTYTLKKDTRFYNLLGGFGEGQPSSLSATASVMWQKGTAGGQDTTDEQSFGYYQINDQMIGGDSKDPNSLPRYPKQAIGYDGSESEMWSPASIWKEENRKIQDYNSTSQKQEMDGGTIINTQIADLTEDSTTHVYTRFDNATVDAREQINIPHNIYDDGGSYEYEDDTIYVNPPLNNTSSQGAYFNEDTNRIDYRHNKVDNIIHRQRTWSTEYE